MNMSKLISMLVLLGARLTTTTVARVSKLLYRRFPIGTRPKAKAGLDLRGVCRLEALRHGRLETCATVVLSSCALLLVAATSFASTNEINWWAFTGGGGKAEQGGVA